MKKSFNLGLNKIADAFEKRAVELTIQLDNEKIISIVQEVSDQYSFFEGQRVKVVKSNYRSRVQPFNN